MLRHRLAFTIAALLIGAAGIFQAPVQAADEESASRIISVAALQQSLATKGQRIVDVRGSAGDYWAGHIPGAVFVHPESLRWTRGGVPVRLMPAEAFAAYLGEIGVTPDTHIIIYGEDNESSAAFYMAAALDDVGHSNYAILEGGYAAWQKAGAPVTTDYPPIAPVRYPVSHSSRSSSFASREEVSQAIAEGGAVVIDVRSAGEYKGDAGKFDRRGHIAGARHVGPDQIAGENGEWKSMKDIQAAFSQAGVKDGQPVILYCNSGRSSSRAWFALKEIAGHDNVKIYNGSFNEWANDPKNPVVTGDLPGAPQAAGKPAVGSAAPGFTAKDQNGHDVSLSDFKDRWVVLYFYPKADTSGCTKEACSFSDNLLSFTNENTVIVGVSGDTVEAQKAFSDKYDLNITLLADPDNKIMSAYGVDARHGEWDGQAFVFAKRATFLIDPDGRIAHIWPSVSVSGHTEEVRAKLAELKK